MKLLVCVDGSSESLKALEKTVEIVSGCRIDKVTLIHVFDKVTFPFIESAQQDNPEIMENFNLMNEELLKEHEMILHQAAEKLKEHNIDSELLLKEGQPAHTISAIAEQEGFDWIVMGSRGRSGLQKSMLGSVSNSVLQETNVSVMVVK